MVLLLVVTVLFFERSAEVLQISDSSYGFVTFSLTPDLASSTNLITCVHPLNVHAAFSHEVQRLQLESKTLLGVMTSI